MDDRNVGQADGTDGAAGNPWRWRAPDVDHDSIDISLDRPRRWRGRLLWGGVVVVAALLVVALLMPATRSAPLAARRPRCQNNVKRITQAILRYGEVHGSLPPPFTRGPDGTPLHSWRTLVLPYLGEEGLFSTIDLSKPWDDPANAVARRSMPAVYACPSLKTPAGRTTSMVVVAPESGFPADGPVALAGVSPATVLVGEFSSRHTVDWMAPQDTDMESWLALGNEDVLHHQGGAYFGLRDGSANFYPGEISRERRRALITVADDPPDSRGRAP